MSWKLCLRFMVQRSARPLLLAGPRLAVRIDDENRRGKKLVTRVCLEKVYDDTHRLLIRCPNWYTNPLIADASPARAPQVAIPHTLNETVAEHIGGDARRRSGPHACGVNARRFVRLARHSDNLAGCDLLGRATGLHHQCRANGKPDGEPLRREYSRRDRGIAHSRPVPDPHALPDT